MAVTQAERTALPKHKLTATLPSSLPLLLWCVTGLTGNLAASLFRELLSASQAAKPRHLSLSKVSHDYFLLCSIRVPYSTVPLSSSRHSIRFSSSVGTRHKQSPANMRRRTRRVFVQIIEKPA